MARSGSFLTISLVYTSQRGKKYSFRKTDEVSKSLPNAGAVQKYLENIAYKASLAS